MCGYDLHICCQDTDDGPWYHCEERDAFEAEVDAALRAQDLAYMSRPEYNPEYRNLPRTYPNGIEGVDEFAAGAEHDIRESCVPSSA
jgi:hypothetical protein